MSMHATAPADPYSRGLRHSQAGRHGEAIACFEAALAANPHEPAVLFALGNTARALGMAEGACEFYRKVLALEPERIEALVNLANLLRETGQPEAAEAMLAPALARTPEAAELWLALGAARRALGRGEEAEHHIRKALELRPDYPAALANLADLLADRGELDEALALYDRVIARQGKNAQARLNRAIVQFLKADLKAGWRDYAARLKLKGKAPICDHRLKPWNGGPLRNTRLLVTAEQGIGDEIMFSGLIPELAARAAGEGGHVILECEARLAPLFARSFPAVKVMASTREAKAGTVTARYGWLKSVGGANAAIEAGTLPRYLRPDLASFPTPHAWLVPDSEETRRWKDWLAGLGRGPVTGICWRSGKSGGARNLQHAPLQAWGRFLAALDGEIVCAQYDARADEVADLEKISGRTIHVPPGLDQKIELDRTCALLAGLDRVVTAPTAVAWLAAGAGVPTFKVLYDTSWTAFGRDVEPFAPACRCLMPDAAGDWADVFAKTGAVLTAPQPAA